MLVKDLIKKLQNVDPEMKVFCTSNTGEYDYCSVSTAMIKGIRIDEVEYNDEDEDTDVFVIDEE